MGLDAFDAYGIDLSPAAVKWAATRNPRRVFCGLLEEVPEIQDQKYDVIFGSHLIEHLTQPSEFLRQASRMLKSWRSGVMVTPNIKSLLSRVSGSRWVLFKIPEHVSYYDPGTITTLLNGTGYTVRAVDSAYQYYALPFVSTGSGSSSTRSPDSYRPWNASVSSATARSASPAAPCASWRPTTATDPRPASRARLHWLRIRDLRARSSIVSSTWNGGLERASVPAGTSQPAREARHTRRR